MINGTELDVSNKIRVNGLDCYGIKKSHAHKRCFGKSENPMISGFNIYVPADIESDISAVSRELIYGGTTIEWFTDQKNISHAKEIDAAIWRLLETWNISSIQLNH